MTGNNSLPRGVIKTTPEEFRVWELVWANPPRAVSFYDESVIIGWDGRSPVTVFGMSKRKWSTEEAVEKVVAPQLGVNRGNISEHGRKDERACTSQLIGVRGKFRPKFYHPEISLVQLYGQSDSLKHGGNWGNRFDILVRSDAEALDLDAAKKIPNFFGPQRLGRGGTEQIGRLLLEGEWETAVRVILTTLSARKFREAEKLAGGSVYKALFHPSFKKSFRFEIQRWQSHLWNRLLREKLESGEAIPSRLPMWDPSEEVVEMYRHLWNPARVDGDVASALAVHDRTTIVRPKDLRAEREDRGWRFNFDLPYGCYATTVLSQLFQLEGHRPLPASR